MEAMWVVGAGVAAFLLLKGEKKAKTPETVAEEVSDQASGMVDDIVSYEENVNGNGADESGLNPDDDLNEDGIVNVLDVVAMVNQSLSRVNGNGNGNGAIGSEEEAELDEVQKDLFDSLSQQRSCVRLYDDQEIDPSTEAVYLLLEQKKGWKVKFKPLQEGSLVMRKYFCPPGREPLQW